MPPAQTVVAGDGPQRRNSAVSGRVRQAIFPSVSGLNGGSSSPPFWIAHWRSVRGSYADADQWDRTESASKVTVARATGQ